MRSVIAITGHTSGIGKALAERFAAQGHEVLGFSRATGHDLAQPGAIERIAEAAAQADMFINNAYYRDAQIDLLYSFYERWKADVHKTIVVIGSVSGDCIRIGRNSYGIYKAALDKTVEQLHYTYPACRIMHLRPGYVDTPRVALVTARKLSADYVAEVVDWMIHQPGHVRTLSLVP